MKIALYLRVSTDVQDFNRQKTDLTNKVKSEGNEIAYIFSDKISGFKNEKDRPELNELLKLTKEDIQAVYITELSRLSRNPTHLRILIDQFTEKGINVYSLVQNIHSLNKEGKAEFTTDLIISILSQYGKYEIDLKNQRVVSGRKEAVTVKGNSYSYKPPFGYMNVEKKLLINENEAIIVKEIFNQYSEGKSIKEIKSYLNLNNIPTRNSDFIKKDSFNLNGKITLNKGEIKWSRSTLSKLLKNPVYTGKKTIKGGFIINTPQIISEDIFQKCQDETKGRIFNVDKSRTNEFMLRGLLKCGECGKNYLGNSSHGNLLYICSDRTHRRGNTFKGCTNSSIGKDKIEPIIWKVNKSFYKTIKSKQISENNISKLNETNSYLLNEIELRESKINDLRKEAARLIKLYVKGDYQENLLDKEQRRINVEILTEEKQIIKNRKLRNDNENMLKAIEQMDSNTYDFDELDQSAILQKEALNDMLSQIIVYKIDNKYTVFEINYKTNFKLYIIREVWTQKYTNIVNSMGTFNPTTKLFSIHSNIFGDLNNTNITTKDLFSLLKHNGIVYQ